jgi:hypothetical protein
VEQQLNAQEQLQQLAAVAVSAVQQQGGGVGGGGGPPRAPPLGQAVGLSPPNSQRKLLAHLSTSMRPADREVRAAGSTH